MAKKKFLRVLRSAHRNLGVFLSIFLLVLAVTGILLNHTESLQLDETPAPTWIASHYLSAEETSGFNLLGKPVYVLAGWLYVENNAVLHCEALLGAAESDALLYVLCPDELQILTHNFEVVEKISPALGLPTGSTKVQVVDDLLVLAIPSGNRSFDPIELISTEFLRPVDWPQPVAIPPEKLLAGSISWQQFLLDLHSGAIVGVPGKLFTDLLAVFVILMAISGLLMWRSRQGRVG